MSLAAMEWATNNTLYRGFDVRACLMYLCQKVDERGQTNINIDKTSETFGVSRDDMIDLMDFLWVIGALGAPFVPRTDDWALVSVEPDWLDGENHKSARIKDWERARRFVINRDQGRCLYCYAEPDTPHIDHFVPRSFGGPNWTYNLITACRSCNSRKSDLRPDHFMISIGLRSRPFRSLPPFFTGGRGGCNA